MFLFCINEYKLGFILNPNLILIVISDLILKRNTLKIKNH